MEFLGYTGATNHITPLENSHTQSRHAQIGCAGQAIVAGPDYDCINIGHGFAIRARRATLSFGDLIRSRSRAGNATLAHSALIWPNPYIDCDVRFGSLADMEASPCNVRFTPESGHSSARRDLRSVPEPDGTCVPRRYICSGSVRNSAPI